MSKAEAGPENLERKKVVEWLLLATARVAQEGYDLDLNESMRTGTCSFSRAIHAQLRKLDDGER